MRNTPTLKPVWCYFRNTGFPSPHIIFSFYPPDVQVTEEPFVTHVTTWYNSNLIAEYSTVTCYITVTEKCNNRCCCKSSSDCILHTVNMITLMKGGFAGALLVALTGKLCLDFLGLRVQQFKNSSLGFGAWIRETSSPAVCLNHD